MVRTRSSPAKGGSPSKSTNDPSAQAQQPAPYHVSVSLKFLLLTTLSAILLAFTVGRAARLFLLDGIRKTLLVTDPNDSSMWDRPDYHALLEDRQVRAAELLLEERAARLAQQAAGGRDRVLPEPRLASHKEVPRTVYSSKKFDLDDMTMSSSDVHIVKEGVGKGVKVVEGSLPKSGEGWVEMDKKDDSEGSETCEEKGGSCSRGRAARKDADIRRAPLTDTGSSDTENDTDSSDDDEEEEEEHLPAGQHLLVDIKDVDANFLNSETRLAKAMVDVVSESELTLLSYHCHSLKPLGVSCVGVLLESHVSFHTWPMEGVITLDLFTCGSKPLVPTIPLIETKFAVPIEPAYEGEVLEPPTVTWSHMLRGFRDSDFQVGQPKDPLASDLGVFMLAQMDFDLKREIVSVQSEFQRIDIYDIIHPRFNDLFSYHKSLSGDGSYESLHPQYYRPDRVVFLDGVMQSTLYGDESYHEALVHPGMFAHPNPKRVAIIGGGEGATLREVLKHNTVETATMIEIDEVMVNVSHEHLPTWSDCSSFGQADWCVEDPRADVRYEDALAWFVDRFTEDGSKKDEADAVPFDVIIMDALDPQDNVPFAEALYDNIGFLTALYSAMSEDGVIVMQLGESPSIADPADSVGIDEKRAAITRLLEEVGFESLHVYEEGHSGFMYPWSYLLAFKSFETRVNWYLNEAEIELNMRKRILPTKDGKNPLKYFDSGTMRTYQVPPKAFETVFCREDPVPKECTWAVGYDKNDLNAPITSFEVKEASGSKGFGIFAKEDIPKGRLFATEELSKAITFRAPTYALMDKVLQKYPEAEVEDVQAYMYFYGTGTSMLGGTTYQVDSGISTFANHGCNGSSNVGEPGFCDVFTETTADETNMPADRDRLSQFTGSIHHIVVDRHLNQIMHGGDVFLRDVKAGDEVLNNYLSFSEYDKEHWADAVLELRGWCAAEK